MFVLHVFLRVEAPWRIQIHIMNKKRLVVSEYHLNRLNMCFFIAFISFIRVYRVYFVLCVCCVGPRLYNHPVCRSRICTVSAVPVVARSWSAVRSTREL